MAKDIEWIAQFEPNVASTIIEGSSASVLGPGDAADSDDDPPQDSAQDPSQAGASYWWSGEDFTPSSWTDAIGSVAVTQGTTGAQPSSVTQAGYSGADFDGISGGDVMSGTPTLADTMTVAILLTPDSATGNDWVWSNSLSVYLARTSASWLLSDSGSGGDVTGGTAAAGTATLVVTTFNDAGTNRLRVDGSEIGTGTAPAQTIDDTFNIGASSSFSNGFDGKIWDLAIWSGSTPDYSTIEAWFLEKRDELNA